MADGQVIIELKLSTEEFQKELAGAEQAARSAGQAVEEALDGSLAALARQAVETAAEFERALQRTAQTLGLPSQGVEALRERLLALGEALPASAVALAEFAGTAAEVFDALAGDGALTEVAGALAALGEKGREASGLLALLGVEQEALSRALAESAQAGERLGESLERGMETAGRSGALAGEAAAAYETLGERMELLRDRMDRVFESVGAAALRGYGAAAAGIGELDAAAAGAAPSLLGVAAALLSVAAGIAAVEQLLGNRSSNRISVDTVGIRSGLSSYQAAVRSAAGTGLHAYAAGTRSASAGWALVGEQGPELMLLGGGETILGAGASADLLRAVSGSSTGGGAGGQGIAAGGAQYYDQSSLTVQTNDDRVLQEIKSWWTHRRMRARAGGGM